MRAAAAIQFASKYLNIGFQLAITAVLARLITPEDFGTLAIVSVFLAFFTMFADMGIGTAIVQFRDLDDSDFGALFVFSALLAVLLAGDEHRVPGPARDELVQSLAELGQDGRPARAHEMVRRWLDDALRDG